MYYIHTKESYIFYLDGGKTFQLTFEYCLSYYRYLYFSGVVLHNLIIQYRSYLNTLAFYAIIF